MAKKYDVLVVGDYFIDLIFTGLPRLPVLGEEVYSQGFEMIPGGTYNTAIALHRLGMKVGWAVDFGNDDFSRLVIGRAQEEGLDASLFVHHDRPLRRITVSASLPQDRAFLTFVDPDPPVPAAIKALGTANARALYVGGLYSGPMLDVGLGLVRLKGMKMIMDGNLGAPVSLVEPAVKKAIRNVDLFLPNAREARFLTGMEDLDQAMQRLGELCTLVVVKDGQYGAHAYQDGRFFHAPGLSLTPVDTTGAGDCFSAGFVAAWMKDLPVSECLKWGNVVGGLSTQAHGGTGRVVRMEDIHEHLDDPYQNQS
jgi:sugar/nucleoside kinase (ribokinase family)